MKLAARGAAPTLAVRCARLRTPKECVSISLLLANARRNHARGVSTAATRLDPQDEHYFAERIGQAPVHVLPVHWGRSTEKAERTAYGPGGRVLPSKGLFAREPIQAGQCVLVEAPLVAAPHFARVSPFQERHTRDTPTGSLASSEASWVYHEAIPPLDRDNADYALPLVERKTPVFWPKTTQTTCSGCEGMREHGVYEMKYCSQACERDALINYHNRLCPSNEPSSSIVSYHRIARELENPFLIQVSRLYAILANCIEKGTKTSEFDDIWQQSPLAKFASSYEVIPLFQDAKMSRAKRFIYEGEGAGLLQSALGDKVPDKYHEHMFAPKTFSWIYNIVQMNCSAIHPKSPWEVYVSNIQKIRPLESLQVVVGHIMNLAEFFARKYELSEEERSQTIFHLLSRSVGNGLYTLHSCMNHSCDPNVEVRNEETKANIHLIATRPIQSGEEICIDYAQFRTARWKRRDASLDAPTQSGLTSDLPSRADRQRFLWHNFGFHCSCHRCRADSP